LAPTMKHTSRCQEALRYFTFMDNRNPNKKAEEKETLESPK